MNLSVTAKILLSYHAQRQKVEKPYSEYLEMLASESTVLRKFQPQFASDRISYLTESTFREFLSFKHNQHWTGLQRSTSKVCNDMPKLRKAIAYLFDEDQPIAERVDQLTKNDERSVPGIGVGILTPLLLVGFPDKYGVWNSKAESALKTLRIWPQFPRGASTGLKYEILNDQFRELSQKTGLNLWAIDGLWHVINEGCKTELEVEVESEDTAQREFYEGKKKPSSGYTYERNPKARSECIRQNGTICVVCGFDFFQVYGELGLGFIHVHHVKDIAMQKGEKIDPKNDLAPVCPNCHAMLHKGSRPARSIADLQKIISQWRTQCSP